MASQSASARQAAEMQADVPAETEFVLSVSKRLKAPRALVFKMFTDGAHLVRWFGPIGHTCVECVVEPSVGDVRRCGQDQAAIALDGETKCSATVAAPHLELKITQHQHRHAFTSLA